MSYGDTLFQSGLFQRYLREMDRLITRLMIVPTEPTPEQIEFMKQFDSHVASSNFQKIAVHHDVDERGRSFSLPNEHYTTAQQQMLELAQKFDQHGFHYRVEQPDVFLPFANLPAVQSLQYLTPDNYAQQVRDLLHGLFRRLLPGSKFRLRGNGILLKLNGNMIKRAYTFTEFMEQDDFWTNFLNENYPFINQSTQEFHEAKRELMEYPFHYITTRNEHTQEVGQSDTIHIYVPLPKPDHTPSESVNTPEGRLYYVHPDLIKELNQLIMHLTRISTSATVLANAYPLFNRHMRKHCEELNEAQRNQHRLAIDAFLQEVRLREHVFTAEQVANFPDELRKSLGIEEAEGEQTIFLPFTNRGFINLFPHHIFIKDTQDPMNKDWSPIPPVALNDLESFYYRGEKYIYKGIALQTGYSDTSPRSGNGTSPLVFGELVYTALHESMYNGMLLNSLDHLDLTAEQKERIKASCRTILEEDVVSDHLAVLVEQVLFAGSTQTVPSYFDHITQDEEEVHEEPSEATDFFEDDDPIQAALDESSESDEPEFEIELEHLVIKKQSSGHGEDRETFTFTQPYTVNGDSDTVYSMDIQLVLADASLRDAFIRFRLHLAEATRNAPPTQRTSVLEAMKVAYAEPGLRYITTDSLEIGETAVV